MTDDRSLERAARSWLEEGPTRAPDDPVTAALARIQTIPQERDHRIPWRLPTMTPLMRLAGAAVIALALAVAGAAIVAMRPASTVGPSAPVATATAAVPITPTAAPSPIPEGTYAVDLPVAGILAALDRDTTLTSEEKQSIIEEILGIDGATTLNLEVVVAGDVFTLRQGTDGSAKVADKPWRMTVIDDHTVEFNAVGGPVNARYEVVPGATTGSFTLRLLGPGEEAVPAFVNRTLFETAPFVPRG